MKYDVVLWGATGFTGRLVAEYLARNEGAGESSPRWALAGRDRAKLEEVRRDLAGIDAAAADLPLLTADAGDPASLRALARQARVVCTTVGPYTQYGSELVAACVDEGAHYCDLTGEVPWMRRMIALHHERARAARLRIVHCCGFDSIPSDLGTMLLQERALAELGRPLPRVTLYVHRMKGGFSGGTVASMASMLERRNDPEVRRALGDPYSLLPPDAPRGPRVRDVAGVAWDAEEEAWIAPFVMAPTNTKVVRRSNALLEMRYGADFEYREVTRYRRRIRGWFGAAGLTAGLGSFVGLMSWGPTRGLLRRRLLPKPGEGPPRKAREAGCFEMEIVGRGSDSAGHAAELRARVIGDQDPGYGSTSGMLAEAALCLAQDGERLPECHGVLTPASAMGQALVERLPRAGVTIEVVGPR